MLTYDPLELLLFLGGLPAEILTISDDSFEDLAAADADQEPAWALTITAVDIEALYGVAARVLQVLQ